MNTLIEESKKSINTTDGNDTLLLDILTIVQRIDERLVKQETEIKKIEEIKSSVIAVNKKVREMEEMLEQVNLRSEKVEKSCEDMGAVIDTVIERCSTNKADIDEIKEQIRKIELNKDTSFETSFQYKEQIRHLQESLLDLRCRSMKYNLIFSGLPFHPNENCEENLRGFLFHELGIPFRVEIAAVHRFGKPGLGGVRPIVARFLYRKELDWVLKNAYKLKGKPFGINEQFPMEIEQERKKLYPIMKKAKQEGKKVQLVRDNLFINNQLFITHEQRRTEFRDVVMAGPPLNQSPPIPPRKRKKPEDSPQRSQEDQVIEQ